MVKKSSILTELQQMINSEHRLNVMESRAQHIISSVIHLIEHIEANYAADESEDLKRKLLNSIKVKDPSKFSRAVKRIKESKNANK